MACGCARECGYLLGLSGRLKLVDADQAALLSKRYEAVQAGLVAASRAFGGLEAEGS